MSKGWRLLHRSDARNTPTRRRLWRLQSGRFHLCGGHYLSRPAICLVAVAVRRSRSLGGLAPVTKPKGEPNAVPSPVRERRAEDQDGDQGKHNAHETSPRGRLSAARLASKSSNRPWQFTPYSVKTPPKRFCKCPLSTPATLGGWGDPRGSPGSVPLETLATVQRSRSRALANEQVGSVRLLVDGAGRALPLWDTSEFHKIMSSPYEDRALFAAQWEPARWITLPGLRASDRARGVPRAPWCYRAGHPESRYGPGSPSR